MRPVEVPNQTKATTVILEVAPLSVRHDQTKEFEAAFSQAQHIIAAMPGYVSHELQRCLEQVNLYILLVRWRTLEDHEVGFRKSAFPTVLHYELVASAGA